MYCDHKFVTAPERTYILEISNGETIPVLRDHEVKFQIDRQCR